MLVVACASPSVLHVCPFPGPDAYEHSVPCLGEYVSFTMTWLHLKTILRVFAMSTPAVHHGFVGLL